MRWKNHGAWERRRERHQMGTSQWCLQFGLLKWLWWDLRASAWERERGLSCPLPLFFHHRLKTQVTSPAAAALSTLGGRGGHYCRDIKLEENLGPSQTDCPGPSLLEKSESSGSRRGHFWWSKGVKITKNCKKYK